MIDCHFRLLPMCTAGNLALGVQGTLQRDTLGSDRQCLTILRPPTPTADCNCFTCEHPTQ